MPSSVASGASGNETGLSNAPSRTNVSHSSKRSAAEKRTLPPSQPASLGSRTASLHSLRSARSDQVLGTPAARPLESAQNGSFRGGGSNVLADISNSNNNNNNYGNSGSNASSNGMGKTERQQPTADLRRTASTMVLEDPRKTGGSSSPMGGRGDQYQPDPSDDAVDEPDALDPESPAAKFAPPQQQPPPQPDAKPPKSKPGSPPSTRKPRSALQKAAADPAAPAGKRRATLRDPSSSGTPPKRGFRGSSTPPRGNRAAKAAAHHPAQGYPGGWSKPESETGSLPSAPDGVSVEEFDCRGAPMTNMRVAAIETDTNLAFARALRFISSLRGGEAAAATPMLTGLRQPGPASPAFPPGSPYLRPASLHSPLHAAPALAGMRQQALDAASPAFLPASALLPSPVQSTPITDALLLFEQQHRRQASQEAGRIARRPFTLAEVEVPPLDREMAARGVSPARELPPAAFAAHPPLLYTPGGAYATPRPEPGDEALTEDVRKAVAHSTSLRQTLLRAINPGDPAGYAAEPTDHLSFTSLPTPEVAKGHPVDLSRRKPLVAEALSQAFRLMPSFSSQVPRTDDPALSPTRWERAATGYDLKQRAFNNDSLLSEALLEGLCLKDEQGRWYPDPHLVTASRDQAVHREKWKLEHKLRAVVVSEDHDRHVLTVAEGSTFAALTAGELMGRDGAWDEALGKEMAKARTLRMKVSAESPLQKKARSPRPDHTSRDASVPPGLHQHASDQLRAREPAGPAGFVGHLLHKGWSEPEAEAAARQQFGLPFPQPQPSPEPPFLAAPPLLCAPGGAAVHPGLADTMSPLPPAPPAIMDPSVSPQRRPQQWVRKEEEVEGNILVHWVKV
ncbi:hypothetical protein DIPPA_22179 [Diplonema papillatum]|nr:hypothetical protein DIPPA_22179 [Diplonema papillatum]